MFLSFTYLCQSPLDEIPEGLEVVDVFPAPGKPLGLIYADKVFVAHRYQAVNAFPRICQKAAGGVDFSPDYTLQTGEDHSGMISV